MKYWEQQISNSNLKKSMAHWEQIETKVCGSLSSPIVSILLDVKSMKTNANPGNLIQQWISKGEKQKKKSLPEEILLVILLFNLNL